LSLPVKLRHNRGKLRRERNVMKRKSGWLGLAILAAVAVFWLPNFFPGVLQAAAEQLQEAEAALPQSPTTIPAQGSIEVAFSPPPGTTDVIVRAMGEAKHRLWIQAYSFTSAPIAKAAMDARKRGVELRVLLDKSQRTQKYSEADFFANQGVDLRIDDQHAIAHNKVMVIDDDTVITGSFNFTRAAEQANAENLLILRGNPALNQLYAANFLHHWSHSTPYQGRLERD